MLHILLTVLAVIGKILLALLGFILLLILLVLLAPFRYKVTGRKQEKDLQAEASVSWLLRVVYVKVLFIDKQLSYELHILGIPVFRLLKWLKSRKSSGKTKKKKKDAAESQSQVTEAVPALPDQKQSGTTERTEGAEVSAEPEPAKEAEPTEEPVETESPEGERAEGPEPSAGGIGEKLSTVFRKIAAILKKVFGIPGTVIKKVKALLEKLKSIKKKIEKLLRKAEDLVEFLKSDLFRQVFELVKHELIAIVRHVLPRKCKGWIEFGASDPGTTGEVLAVAGMLYPVLPRKLVLYPDFDQAVLNLDVSLGGRIRLIVLVFRGVKIILNKNVRRVIKKIRHREA